MLDRPLRAQDVREYNAWSALRFQINVVPGGMPPLPSSMDNMTSRFVSVPEMPISVLRPHFRPPEGSHTR